MTRHQDIFVASSWPPLYEQHGQEVTRRPLGDDDDDVEVEALWQLGQLVPGYQPEDLGQVAEHFGVLRLRPADAGTPDLRDLFVIDADLWSVAAFGRRTPLVTVQLRRVDQSHVKGLRRIER